MASFTSIDALKTYLLGTQGLKEQISLYNIEGLCAPLFAEIGLDSSIQHKLAEYALVPEGRWIDATEALKALGVIAQTARSSKTKRILAKANVFPLDNEEGSEATMITKRGLFKVLQRVHNDDRFSDYFLLKLELAAIYNQYQIGRDRLNDVVDHKNDTPIVKKNAIAIVVDHRDVELKLANPIEHANVATDAAAECIVATEASFGYRCILGQRMLGGRHEVLLDWEPTWESVEMIDDATIRTLLKQKVDIM